MTTDQGIPRQLLTVGETANALGLGVTSVKALIYSNKLGSVKIGPKTRRVPVTAIDTFIAELQAEGDG